MVELKKEGSGCNAWGCRYVTRKELPASIGRIVGFIMTRKTCFLVAEATRGIRQCVNESTYLLPPLRLHSHLPILRIRKSFLLTV